MKPKKQGDRLVEVINESDFLYVKKDVTMLERAAIRLSNVFKMLRNTHITTTENMIADVNQFIHCDSSAAEITINLNTAVNKTGRRVTIQKFDESPNNVIVDAYETETINGQETLILTEPWQVYTLESDGFNWHVV